jgi:hypothetical protein
MMLNLIFIFWLYNIQQNKQLREEWKFGQDSMDSEASFLLYSHMLTTGASFVPSSILGAVFTPWGVCYSKGRRNRLAPFGFSPVIYDTIHLRASKRLMRMLRLMTMSSTILLPKLLPGFGRCRARILMHLMRKIRYPTIMKSNSFQNFFASFPQSSITGWRTNLLVVPPLDSRASAQCTAAENSCDAIFRHSGVNKSITVFLQKNPGFSLNFGELLDMVHWSFMHQQNLRKMNARMFGLNFLDLTSNQVLEMTPERIFEVANEDNLLTLALKFFLKEKEKTQKM